MVLTNAHKTLFKKIAKRRPLFLRRRRATEEVIAVQDESMTNSMHLKLVVAGKRDTGKSLFVTTGTSSDLQKIQNDDGSITVPRIGDNGEMIYLHIYEIDVGGTEIVDAAAVTSALTHANAIVAFCDMEDFDSLKPIEPIVEQARAVWTSIYTADSLAEHLPIYVVGNNRDAAKRSMLKTNTRLLAVQLDAEFAECNAQDESEVQEIFRQIILKLSRDPNLIAYAYKPPENAVVASRLISWNTLKQYGPMAFSVASLGVSLAAMVITRRPTPQAAGWIATLGKFVLRR